MLQHDEAKAYIQTRMQIPSQIRKAGYLKRKSANQSIQGTSLRSAPDAKR